MPSSVRVLLPLILMLTLSFPALAGGDALLLMISVTDQRARAERVIRELSRTVLADPIILAGLRQSSEANDTLTGPMIAERDEEWRRQAKRGRGPLVESIMGGPVSRQLSLIRLPRSGLVADLMLMDDKGLLVGATRLSNDYDQSDETKYQHTFPDGPEALIVEMPAYDESVDDYVLAVSITLTDPEGGRSLGVLTANMALTALQQ